ncbi:hypothetical protein F383_07583 [Gossypium arboreum]|uniref:Uncharacterized protein n=1 Tax=Gossypium arboreum TaxID=29729 RepID=A0A0B0PEQ4_GOSAR|nr:hypothetical protein F383_07583 [Gossypium arboreum]
MYNLLVYNLTTSWSLNEHIIHITKFLHLFITKLTKQYIESLPLNTSDQSSILGGFRPSSIFIS